uniref:Uncharacterized protein n=1 Tax=Lotus japonicus TaxID=34305 RepID=I3SQ06_LOTJA|nr:unknown [Lotus japonicus]
MRGGPSKGQLYVKIHLLEAWIPR